MRYIVKSRRPLKVLTLNRSPTHEGLEPLGAEAFRTTPRGGF